MAKSKSTRPAPRLSDPEADHILSSGAEQVHIPTAFERLAAVRANLAYTKTAAHEIMCGLIGEPDMRMQIAQAKKHLDQAIDYLEPVPEDRSSGVLEKLFNLEAGCEEAECTLAFLMVAQPTSAIDFAGDTRLPRGEDLVRARIAHLVDPEGRPGVLNDKTPSAVLSDLADVLYFLHNVEPIEGKTFCDGGKVQSGHAYLLMWVEDVLFRLGGAGGRGGPGSIAG